MKQKFSPLRTISNFVNDVLGLITVVTLWRITYNLKWQLGENVILLIIMATSAAYKIRLLIISGKPARRSGPVEPTFREPLSMFTLSSQVDMSSAHSFAIHFHAVKPPNFIMTEHQ